MISLNTKHDIDENLLVVRTLHLTDRLSILNYP